jgi:hypothetical protein
MTEMRSLQLELCCSGRADQQLMQNAGVLRTKHGRIIQEVEWLQVCMTYKLLDFVVIRTACKLHRLNDADREAVVRASVHSISGNVPQLSTGPHGISQLY